MIAHCVPLLICMHSNVRTTKTCTVSTISTPKVPASFQFHQVLKRSHTLSNWDAIQDAFCTGTRRTCSSQSSAEMQRKSRQRKKQIHKNCPCSNVHMNRDDIPSYTPSMSPPEASLPNEMFEEFRCCWATIRIFYSESIRKVFRVVFNACFGVNTFLLHRAPCQLLIETYGLDVNHKDSNGQTCSSTAISMPSLCTRKKIAARKTLFVDVQKCRQCVLKCVCVSCSFL